MTTRTKKKRGAKRPPKTERPKAVLDEAYVGLRASREQVARWTAIATGESRSLSNWMRLMLDRAAEAIP